MGPEAGEDRSLVGWLREQELLRGPFLYRDYWASVLGLSLPGADRRVARGWLEPSLFRLGLDRPDLELPRLRHYLLLFLVGPFLVPFRSFRRLGRYRLSFRSPLAGVVLRRLERYRLETFPAGAGGSSGASRTEGRGAGAEGFGTRAEGRGTRADGRRTGREDERLGGEGRSEGRSPGPPRVDVELGGETLAEGVLDPRAMAGFASLFYATYKLPLASLSAILLAGLGAPLLQASGLLDPVLALWVPVGFPLLVLALYLVWRDWITAVLGALPVVVARFLFSALSPGPGGGWDVFGLALGGLFLLYLLVDGFFMPRPVPPVLLLYTASGDAAPYDRREDGPWWLEGESYWVWRYLMLTPAELNKFWERDWERIELWIRADGPRAGALEWVVTDAHYRELWIPYRKLDDPDRAAAHREAALETLSRGGRGFWLLEADADTLFHTPFTRAVSFVPEEERAPARGVGHLLHALRRRGDWDDPDDYRDAVERVRLELGHGLFRDAPEVASRLVERHLLAQPWRWWRYPLGAVSRREDHLYGRKVETRPPAVSEPALQVKAPGSPTDGTVQAEGGTVRG